MAINVDLKPEVEAQLTLQARAAGLSLAQFLNRQLEAIAPTSKLSPPATEMSDHWDKELDEWLDSFPQETVLADEALQRENWYPDRW